MRRLVLALALFAAAPVYAAGDDVPNVGQPAEKDRVPADQSGKMIDRGPMGTNPVDDVSRPHEVLSDRPSGFWTSNRPAVGGAYKWRLLEIGCAIALLTGWLTWRLVKNTKAPPRARVIER
ncbi:MAG TPA: hypothetical protein VFQ65_30795 [Kofleriaceae bacterium]|nr:hypothetical protein [Kofleriaceae bacterium]